MGGLHVDGFRSWLVCDEPLTESPGAARMISFSFLYMQSRSHKNLVIG